jgi:capsular polysaccharide biosynthesis protein
VTSVLILKELWRRWYFVLLAIVIAAGAAFMVLSKEDSKPEAEGSIQVLVDSANSPIANARRDLTGFTARAAVFARVMSGGNVIRQVAKAAHVPVNQIDVAGPMPLPGQAPGISEGNPHELPYRIEITQQTELPIITVSTHAPTVAAARALAAAAPEAISDEVESIQDQQETPEGRRVEFRTLGPAEAAPVDNSSGKKIAAGIFIVLLVFLLGLIVGIPRFVAAWRAADAEPGPGGGGFDDDDHGVPANGNARPGHAKGTAKGKRSRRRRRANAKQAKKAEEKSSADAAPASEEINATSERPVEREESGARG